jgi:hypothetical protein
MVLNAITAPAKRVLKVPTPRFAEVSSARDASTIDEQSGAGA